MKIGKLGIHENMVNKTKRIFENIDGVTLSVVLDKKEISNPFVCLVRA